MQFTVMRPAERHRKFIADLLSEPALLRKAQMVRVAGLSAADEAGLPGHKAQCCLSRRVWVGKAPECRCSIWFVGRGSIEVYTEMNIICLRG